MGFLSKKRLLSKILQTFDEIPVYILPIMDS